VGVVIKINYNQLYKTNDQIELSPSIILQVGVGIKIKRPIAGYT
jgi:hypothetical protein